ncbi:putative Zn finger protein [Leptomonas seymouri]|uniref:Putative Zn finger protein n=1 Tax=Leptomonas seymouri TaxID=5684 RepID=A0A0N1I7W2_LEPSE|nr:putative Zn finger protein [Leptomonas seymouri]|eukprot:KPI89778.1 putative Zn finger protein [Leptomonas seymouri]
MWRPTNGHRLTRHSAVLSRSGSGLAKCRFSFSSFSATSPPPSCSCIAAVTPMSSLCVATRSLSSTQVSASVAAAPSTSHTSGSQRGMKKLRFWTPDIMTHESLSYAACPMCGGNFYMRDMLFHIMAIHKEADVAYWTEQCNARLAMYERVVGIPLAPSTSSSVPSDAAMNASGDPLFGNHMSKESFISQEAFRALLPTITADGGYACNWCVVKHPPFPTRDAFLLHVAKDHPTMDFDLVESLVSPPPSASSSASADAVKSAEAEEVERPEDSSKAQQASTLWKPAGKQAEMGAAVEDAELGAQDGGTRCLGPTRRMPGVKIVLQSNTFSVKATPRHFGVSISRTDSTGREPAPLGTISPPKASAPDAANREATSSVEECFFREHHFPCELCLKVFASELNLLQHLESKHLPLPPTSSLEGVNTAAGTAAATEKEKVAPAARSPAAVVTSTPSVNTEKTSNAPTTISVSCDLCSKHSKIYTLPSALFAHIRFCHRNADTTYEAERMMREQRDRPVYRCPRCPRPFHDQAALRDHLWEWHGVAREEAKEVLLNSADASADPVTVTNDNLAVKYACPTLPPFSMKKRWWCGECECGFGTPLALAAHKREKHTAVTELFPCPACRRVFHDVFTLEEHVRTTHRSVQLVDMNLPTSSICPHCNRGFLDYVALHEHCVKHHHKNPNSPVRPFAKPDASTAAAEGTAEATAGSVPSKIDAPPTPRKVSRRKRTTPAGA